MTEKKCKNCKNIIIKEWEEYLKKFPFESEIICPHCDYRERLV